MLKLLMRHLYKNVDIENKELFYDIYKWEYALPVILRSRYLIYSVFLYFLSLIFIFRNSAKIIQLVLLSIAIIFMIADIYERRKSRKNCYIVSMSNFWIRGIKLEEKLRKLVTLANSKVLPLNDWKKIKHYDKGLYKDLLSDESCNCCYYYSREIGLITKETNLIWCSILDPFDSSKLYAHAILEKNGYIYDTNLRRTYNYKEYAKLFNLIVYKNWSYNDYSKTRFTSNEREEFRTWCIQNGVSHYKNF